MIEKTPQGFVSRYAIPTPPEPVENAAAHAAVDGPTDREIFDAGFRHGVLAGDNHIHYHGEQADRIFERAIKALRKMAEAFPLPAEPVEQAGGKDFARECYEKIATVPMDDSGCVAAIQSAITAATAELQAKVERLEGEDQINKTVIGALKESIESLKAAVSEQGDLRQAAESQLTALREQLAKIAKCANHEQASRCLLAGDSWKNIGCNMIDSIQAIINPPGSSPSPSRPSGEEVERKLLEWLSTAAIVRVSGVDCILGDSAANSIAAKVRRIVEGESK